MDNQRPAGEDEEALVNAAESLAAAAGEDHAHRRRAPVRHYAPNASEKARYIRRGPARTSAISGSAIARPSLSTNGRFST
jgi:hypothetical protein